MNRFDKRKFAVSLLFVLLVSYGVFNARNILIGPEIEIMSPIFKNDLAIRIDENPLIISGRAKNITSLSLNQKSIFTDKEGFFKEKLLLSDGFNIIEIRAKDRFKNEVQKYIRIYYKEK